MIQQYMIRDARRDEFHAVGQLMVNVYSQLDGFPSQHEQPEYYRMLANIGSLTNNPKTRLLVAVNDNENLAGAVVYFGDMAYYGSGGTAPQEKDAGGFRLLAVDTTLRGQGVGKLLSLACVNIAREEGKSEVIIHSTEYMEVAWAMYEKIGFKRSEDLDFMQEKLPVFGFRLALKNHMDI